ncbi:tetratricopeptide repeat protein [Pseudaeromonas paramecii]|uniref:GGDEF domain-containing protein n=1 Tax=Pseudaeromonas paramecii TaxID=2138166 RepID=A0ABP8Q554_9GAMM
MQLVSLVLLLSGLQLPPPLLDRPDLPSELAHAQEQGLSRPDLCIQLSHNFLRRDPLSNRPLSAGRSNQAQPELEQYRTPSQTVMAQLILSRCLSQNQQFPPAERLLEESRQLARRGHQPDLEAFALYLQARLLALDTRDYIGSQLAAERLDKLIQRGARLPDPLQEQRSWLQILTNIERSHIDDARNQLEKWQQRLQRFPTPGSQAWYFALYGELMRSQQQDDLALGYYSDAMKLAGEYDDFLLQAQMADRMSDILHRRGDMTQAIRWGEMAVDNYQRINNGVWLADALIRLADLVRESGNANLALALLFNALDLYRNVNRPLQLAELNHQIGKTYLMLGKYIEARAYLIAARNAFKLSKSYSGELRTLLALGDLYLAQQDAGVVIPLVENAVQQLPQGETPPPEIFLLLSRAYEQKGLFAEALHNYKRFNASLRQQQEQQQSLGNEQFRTSYALLDKERQLKTMAATQADLLAQKRHYLWYCALATLGLLTLGFILLQVWLRGCRREDELQASRARLLQVPSTGLPSMEQLLQDLTPPTPQGYGNLNYLDIHPEHPLNQKRQFVALRLPGLDQLSDQIGEQQTERVEQILVSRIRDQLPEQAQLYHQPGGKLMMLFSQSSPQSVTHWLETMFTQLKEPLRHFGVPGQLAAGLVSYPFLSRAPRAVSSIQLLEVAQLALAAARQLAEKTTASSWVELSAIDCQQAAFFNGQIRARTLQAIDKGLVKVNALHGKQLIDWHLLGLKDALVQQGELAPLRVPTTGERTAEE